MADVEDKNQSGMSLSSFMEGKTTSSAPQTTAPSGIKLSNFIGEPVDSQPSTTQEQTPVKTLPKEEEPYERLIQKHMPSAKEEVEKGGAKEAFQHGLLNVPYIAPAIQEGLRKYKAFSGEGEGGTYEERLQDLRAKQEAYNRQVKEQHPYAELGGEVAQGVGLAFVPGVGWIPAAARAATLGRFGKLAATGAEVAGFGAEGAAFAGAQAAGEKQFGTAQPSEQKDVGEAAKEGAMFGAGLATAGKAIGKTVDTILPEWVKGFGNKDKYQTEMYFKKLAEDKADGNLNFDLNDVLHARKEGLDMSLFDMRGPKADAWIQDTFRNHPEAVHDFKSRMNERVFGSGERGLNFLQDVAGVTKFNPAKLKDEAKEYANRINEQNFAEAYDRNNAQGSWKDEWTSRLQDKDIGNAVNATNRDMKRLYGDDFKNPFGRRGELEIDTLNIPEDKLDSLRSHGVNTIDDLNSLTPEEIQKMYGLNPKSSTLEDLDKPLKTGHIYDEIRSYLKGVNPDSAAVTTPEQINAEYLDRLQQQLKITAQGIEKGKRSNLEKPFSERANSFRSDIIDSLTNKNSELYNQPYADAFQQRDVFHRNEDAFTSGQEFLRKLRDTEHVSRTANETAQMTPKEKEYFKQGLLSEMSNQGIKGGGPSRGAYQESSVNYTKIKNWLAKPDIKEAISNVLGPEDYKRMEVYLRGEELLNNAVSRTKGLEEKGNLFDYLMRHATLPGLTGLFGWLHSSPLGLVGVGLRTLDYYMGSRYARSLGEKLGADNPEAYKELYDRIVQNPRLRDNVNVMMGVANYTLANEIAGKKSDMHRVTQYINTLPEGEMRDQAKGLVRQAVNIGTAIRENDLSGLKQQAGFNQGGRVEYGDGGKTPYNWRQHYVPKDNTVGPVAPARASGYYADEWKRENRALGYAGYARAMRNRAEREGEEPVDELMEGKGRPKRQDGGRLTDVKMPQSVTSEKTSLNQVPALFKSDVLETVPNHRNVDIGGGAYDLGTQYLANERGIESHVFDPFNRSEKHNAAVEKRFAKKPAHTATVANVLNVIPEEEHRLGAIQRAYDMTHPEGKSYFSIYEGDRSGNGVVTPKGWQNNKPAEHYVGEVNKVFPHVVRKGKIIVGHKVHPNATKIKRATGGRIPEADKLFKDAKKYIDSHTKGLLNEPDERIVQALRIAKARNG